MLIRINSALDASRAQREENEKGFTLIELLVVVIIIGILAAIAIPVFLNQRESAWRASVESDLKNAATAVETFASHQSGSYAGVEGDYGDGTDAIKVEIGTGSDVFITVSEGNTLTVALVGTTGYTITGDNANYSGHALVYDSEDGGLGDWS